MASDDDQANRMMPSVVEHIPMGRLPTKGRLSNANPTAG